MWYNISEANEYLVVTGAGIEGRTPSRFLDQSFTNRPRCPYRKEGFRLSMAEGLKDIGVALRFLAQSSGVRNTSLHTALCLANWRGSMTIEKLKFALPAVFTIGTRSQIRGNICCANSAARS
jgi:hypothetical protein